MQELRDHINTDDMIVHYQTIKGIASEENNNISQKKINRMIDIFNGEVEWENDRIRAYFNAVNYIVNGGNFSASEKIEWAANRGYTETNLITFDRNTIIPGTEIKLLGLIYHSKHNKFYSENGLIPIVDYIKKIMTPYNINFWKPKKDMWVIQALWEKDLFSHDSKKLDENVYSDSTSEDEYSNDFHSEHDNYNHSLLKFEDNDLNANIVGITGIIGSKQTRKTLPIFSNEYDRLEIDPIIDEVRKLNLKIANETVDSAINETIDSILCTNINESEINKILPPPPPPLPQYPCPHPLSRPHPRPLPSQSPKIKLSPLPTIFEWGKSLTK